MAVEFLSVEDALHIHQNQIDQYGGEHGVRNEGLLASAIAQPQATFGGEFLHADVFAMAAAYLFHLVQNHPFLDGNKRTGAVVAMVFLNWNGVALAVDSERLVEITLRVAMGTADKPAVADFFRSLVVQP